MPTDCYRALLLRNRGSWDRIPSNLKFTSYSSASAIPSKVRTAISLVYLAFLNTDLYVYRMQERESIQPSANTVQVASDSLAAVVELGAFGKQALSTCDHSRVVRTATSIEYSDINANQIQMFVYGLQAAVAITSALPNLVSTTKQASQLPTGVTISSLIRNLSVYVSQLKSAAAPDEPNYDLCTEASKVISRTLDSVLDGSFSQMHAFAGPTSTEPQQINGDDMAENARLDASTDVAIGSLDLWGDFDVEGWMNSLERSAFSGEELSMF